MPLIALSIAAMAFAAVATGAPDGPSTASADPNETLVEELVVTARERGPAWWRVSDADTTVYVLGAPGALPKSQTWDPSVLDRRVAAAHTVVLPFNNVGIGLLAAPRIVVALAHNKGGPFEDRLDGELKARFIAARTRIGKPAKRYGLRSELVTAVLLIGDARDSLGLTAVEPGRTVAAAARSHRVRTVSKTYPLEPILEAALRADPATQRACLEDVLKEIDAAPAPARRAAEAWATGDVANALTSDRSYETCLAAVPGARRLDEALKSDTASAIEAALAKPGVAVAVVQLRPLLARGGVLDQLRSKGFTIRTPGDS